MMTRASLVLVLALSLLPAAVPRDAQPEWVKVATVDIGLSEVGPVVFLRAGSRAMPIFVDPVVASAIQSALGGPKPPRPLSHDLMETILLAYDAKVTKASITLKEDVFYADLVVTRNGKETTFDSRSSDAIALAVRFDAPIYVRRDQLDSAGKRVPGREEQIL